MALFLISRVFVFAENDFNQIKENFLNSQKGTDASGSPDQAITCTCPFTSSSQASQFSTRNLFLSSRKGN